VALPRLNAVVVGSVDVADTHRILRVLSAEEGRGSVMVRGARSSRRRYAGALDPGTQSILIRNRRKGQLDTLKEVDVVSSPKLARRDLDRLTYLLYGCELCARLAPEGHPAPKLFKLLVTWLAVLEGASQPGSASRVALEAKALTFAGLTPVLDRCSRCNRAPFDPMAFNMEAGGAVHAHCAGGSNISVDLLRQMEALRRTPLVETVEHPPMDRNLWYLTDFAEHQLAGNLKTRQALKDLALDVGPGS
jgi:DNA repair protein RecO (recombination protein O)